MASISLDDIVKIIDVSHLGSRVKEDFDEEEYEKDLVANPRTKKTKGGDEDMEEEKGSWESDDYSDDDDSSSDEDEPKKTGKKDKKLNVKANNV